MKVLKLVCMILGCFIGAGFISGREIVSYFSTFGSMSYFLIVIAGVVFFLLLYLFFSLSSKVNSFGDFVKKYFGKFHLIITILFLLSLLIVVSSMLAGLVSLAESIKCNSFLLVFITLILCYFAVVGNSQCLTKINMILMPFVVGLVIIVCGVSIDIGTIKLNDTLFPLLSSINYVLINIMMLGMFVVEIGGEYSKKQKLWATLIVTMVIATLMLLINHAIIENNLLDFAVPLLELAKCKGIIYQYAFSAVIWCGLFTTLMSNVFVLDNYLVKYVKSNKFSIFLILCIALCISAMGFEFIVGYVYSIIGIVGLVFLCTVIKKEREICVKISRKK